MFDFNFNWDDSINTEIEVIDTQHKELFRIGRAIEQLLITQCIGVKQDFLLGIVCDLREYASYHFYHEERLMELYCYSELNQHKKMHSEFMKFIVEINCKNLGEEPCKELKKVQDELKKFVFQHMITEDSRMAKEILQRDPHLNHWNLLQ